MFSSSGYAQIVRNGLLRLIKTVAVEILDSGRDAKRSKKKNLDSIRGGEEITDASPFAFSKEKKDPIRRRNSGP